RSAEIEEMFTMAPPWAVRIISGIAALEARNMVSTLTCMTRRQVSGLLHHAALAADAHVVDQEVETAVAAHRLAGHRRALRLVGDVEREGGRLAPFASDHLDGALGEALVAVDDQHAGPAPREQDARRAPVADAVARGAATGDDGHASLQSQVVVGARRRCAPGAAFRG